MNLRPSWAGKSDRAIEIAFRTAAKATITSSNRRPAMPILLDLEPKHRDARNDAKLAWRAPWPRWAL
jgi:hypothetical protein